MITPIRERWVERSETGAVAVLVAISMLVLMGFAAVAVDGGILFNDRRQQQSAADGGALAAVQFAKTGLPTVECTGLSGTPRAACRGAEEAIDVVDGTLPGRYALGDWDICEDTGKLAIVSSLSDCISFSDSFQKARVVLPGTDVDTSFARVIGIDTVRVGAFAEATLDLNYSGGILPFGVGPSGAGSDHICMLANPNNGLGAGPCDGPAEGNFGKMHFYLYGNDTMGTPQICGGSNAQRMRTNIVLGTDHPIEVTDGPPIVHDQTNCPLISNPVDQVPSNTGVSSKALEDGLFDGIATPALEGRLVCKGALSTSTAGESLAQGFVSQECADISNEFPEKLDHTPLWYYITPGAASQSGGACEPSISDRAGMETCLAAWKAFVPDHTVSLFKPELTESPRFAGIPILDEDLGGGSDDYLITDFRPVYIETIYFSCTSSTCQVIHSPGEDSDSAPPADCPDPITSADSSCGWPDDSNQGIVAVTVFLLTLDMLDPEVAANFPGRPGTIVYNLSK